MRYNRKFGLEILHTFAVSKYVEISNLKFEINLRDIRC